MALPSYASPLERIWRWVYLLICGLILLFLIAPILIIIPLSFNAQPYFTFTQKMLALDPEGYSLRWYDFLLTFGMAAPDAPRDGSWWADAWANAQWIRAAKNSIIIGVFSTVVATVLGTLAALGLARPEMPFRRTIMAILLSPMIVPIIITATGLFFFYSATGLSGTYVGLILAHAVLGIPFVIITVTATLVGFDRSLSRAAEAGPRLGQLLARPVIRGLEGRGHVCHNRVHPVAPEPLQRRAQEQQEHRQPADHDDLGPGHDGDVRSFDLGQAQHVGIDRPQVRPHPVIAHLDPDRRRLVRGQVRRLGLHVGRVELEIGRPAPAGILVAIDPGLAVLQHRADELDVPVAGIGIGRFAPRPEQAVRADLDPAHLAADDPHDVVRRQRVGQEPARGQHDQNPECPFQSPHLPSVSLAADAVRGRSPLGRPGSVPS